MRKLTSSPCKLQSYFLTQDSKDSYIPPTLNEKRNVLSIKQHIIYPVDSISQHRRSVSNWSAGSEGKLILEKAKAKKKKKKALDSSSSWEITFKL